MINIEDFIESIQLQDIRCIEYYVSKTDSAHPVNIEVINGLEAMVCRVAKKNNYNPHLCVFLYHRSMNIIKNASAKTIDPEMIDYCCASINNDYHNYYGFSRTTSLGYGDGYGFWNPSTIDCLLTFFGFLYPEMITTEDYGWMHVLLQDPRVQEQALLDSDPRTRNLCYKIWGLV